MKLSIRLVGLLLIILTLLRKTCNTETWWDGLEEGPTCFKPGTCGENDEICECVLNIEHRLTMMTSPNPVLVWPKNGSLYRFDDAEGNNPLTKNIIENTITADGVGSRMVITVNGLFPGPSIVAYKGQTMIIHVRNLMHTESTSIHWHGIKQTNTVDSDGVAFITQCPIPPGQNFTYRFIADPIGTHFYHAQIGNQQSMGLYGALVIYHKEEILSKSNEGFIVLLQDWNHYDDPDTSYLRMLDGVYDLNTRKKINAPQSVDGTNFTDYQFHSGLINGMGRFYKTASMSNEAPLQVFEVKESQTYRFRVINAGTAYPFRVYIEGHQTLTIESSDAYEIFNNGGTTGSKLVVESFIIHPGERFDFILHANQEPGTYLLVAESLEVLNPSVDEYHVAEAIVHYSGTPVMNNPPKATPNICTPSKPCNTFNCPFEYYPLGTHRNCWTFHNDSYSKESNYKNIINVDETLYFNFGIFGDLIKKNSSVNGRQFLFPSEPILYRFSEIQARCENAGCGENNVCQCTNYINLEMNKSYQLVISNIGEGKGWSHPIHLHGYSFYVVKMGLGSYDSTTAELLQETNEIRCTGESAPNMCNAEIWKSNAWVTNPNIIPGIKFIHPPIKDTIIVPSGGYVVIRFITNNPGPWFFHSQVDFHTTNGMGMVLLVGDNSKFKKSTNPLTCWNQEILKPTPEVKGMSPREIGLTVTCVLLALVIVSIFMVPCVRYKKCVNPRNICELLCKISKNDEKAPLFDEETIPKHLNYN